MRRPLCCCATRTGGFASSHHLRIGGGCTPPPAAAAPRAAATTRAATATAAGCAARRRHLCKHAGEATSRVKLMVKLLENVCMPSASPNIAFVYTNAVSSSTYRGNLVARALNQSYLRCGDLYSQSRHAAFWDIVVHLKQPCVAALPHGRHHVIDHIDALPDRYAAFRKSLGNFSGQIFNTDDHLRKECCTRVCAVIPHHCNLPCMYNDERSELRQVGVVGWTQASLSIGHQLAAHGIKTEAEPKGRWHTFGYGLVTGRPAEICRFFDGLSVAVAWNEEMDGYDPGQRFTNPICLGIPTIGFSRQASFQAHEGSSRFLCSDVECVRRLVEQIHAGTLSSEFQTLSEGVRQHVSWPATRTRYETVFEQVLTSREHPVRHLFSDKYQNDLPASPKCRARTSAHARSRSTKRE